VIKAGFFELPLKIRVQEVQLSAPRRLKEARGWGAQRTVSVREHRKTRLNSRFEAE